MSYRADKLEIDVGRTHTDRRRQWQYYPKAKTGLGLNETMHSFQNVKHWSNVLSYSNEISQQDISKYLQYRDCNSSVRTHSSQKICIYAIKLCELHMLIGEFFILLTCESFACLVPLTYVSSSDNKGGTHQVYRFFFLNHRINKTSLKTHPMVILSPVYVLKI